MTTITIIGGMKYTTLMCVLAKKIQSNVKDCIVFIPDMIDAVIHKNIKNKHIDDIELNNLKAKHMKLIEISDFVLCIDSHINKGTREELKYAKNLKRV